MATEDGIHAVIEEFLPNIRKSKQLASDCESFCERLREILDGGVVLDDEDHGDLAELGVKDVSGLIDEHKELLMERDELSEALEELRCELDKMILFILNRPDAELRQRLNELQEYLGRDGEPISASSFGIFAHI